MRSLKDISIQRKLMALAMVAAITAMGLAATAFVFNDLQMIRKDAIHVCGRKPLHNPL